MTTYDVITKISYTDVADHKEAHLKEVELSRVITALDATDVQRLDDREAVIVDFDVNRDDEQTVITDIINALFEHVYEDHVEDTSFVISTENDGEIIAVDLRDVARPE